MNQKRSASPIANTTLKLTKTTAEPSMASQILELPPLPTEIWTSIFEHLSSDQLLTLRQVCHRWRNVISGSPSLLAKLTVTFPVGLTICGLAYQPDSLPAAAKVHFNNVTINEIGPWWTPFGQSITELKLSSYSTVDYASLLVMLSYTPNLKCFELIDSKLSGARTSGVVDFRLEKLEKLVLCGLEDSKPVEFFRALGSGLKSLRVTWNCFMEGQIVSPQEMVTLLGGLQNTLEELYITCTEGTLVEVMKLDRLKLQKLTLSGDEQSEDLTIYLIELCRAQPSLQYLKIKGIVTFNETNHLLLCKIGKMCPNLSFLQIIGTYVDLALLHSFSKLQTLKLSGDPDTSVTIQFKGDDPLNLKELHLKKIHFEDSCLQQHLPKKPDIRSMSLNWCTFNYWSDLLEALKSLNQLQSLTLNGINVNESDDCTLDGFATTVNHLQLSHCEMSPKLLAMVLGG